MGDRGGAGAPGGVAGDGGGCPAAHSDTQSVPPSSCNPVSLKHHTLALRAAHKRA
jgi:hypothetical protein